MAIYAIALKNERSHGMNKDYPVLKGMFERGIAKQGARDKDDEVLDRAALLLTRVHGDKTILPSIVDMIFYRNREGLFTHDLIWAFFGAKDPYSLMLIANYLGSAEEKDVFLARKLLDFVPNIDMAGGKDSRKQYIQFLSWLEENYSFLYFTGESFQRTSRPIPYVVDLEAKYLCRAVSITTGEPLIPFRSKEKHLIGYFTKLDEDHKLLLSEFSFRIHHENIYLWNSWIDKSITRQISIAKDRRRVNDYNF